MSISRPLCTTHGIDLFERPNGDVYGYRGSEFVGITFPVRVDSPDGEWFARTSGYPVATEVPSRHAGIAHVVGGCPDCVCEPVLCETDDTGDSCLSCGFCLNGCSTGECPWPATDTEGATP